MTNHNTSGDPFVLTGGLGADRQAFGFLALDVAGITLPPDAPPAARAAAIRSAIANIATSPDLMHQITGEPYNTSWARAVGLQLRSTGKKADELQKSVLALRASVQSKGHLIPADMPAGHTIQLNYAPTPGATYRWRRRAPLTLLVSPQPGWGFDVQTYGTYDFIAGFSKPDTAYRDTVSNILRLGGVLCEYPKQIPPKLINLQGDVIRITRIATGATLNYDHKFRRICREVPGYKERVTHSTASQPYMLQQAYLGPTTLYPLF